MVTAATFTLIDRSAYGAPGISSREKIRKYCRRYRRAVPPDLMLEATVARTLLHLVRHGEQAPAEAGGGLSELGGHQASRLGQRLRDVPFSTIHHSPILRAVETADLVAGHLPGVPRHCCELVTDRTPVPSQEQRSEYPERFLPWLDGIAADERDEDAVRLRAAVERLGDTGVHDRHELVITHNFVIGWFVRHVMDAPEWRWIGLNQENCGLTIVAFEAGRPPALVSFNDVGHLRD